MTQAPKRHHHLPECYLKKWCGPDDKLFRYRRVGPAGRIEVRKHPPKSVGWEKGLYSVPAGMAINGHEGAELETELARTVDQRLPAIVGEAEGVSGEPSERLARDLRWLARCFYARSPGQLEALATNMGVLQTEETPRIDRLWRIAVDPPDMLKALRSSDFPKLMALLPLTWLVDGLELPDRYEEHWFGGRMLLVEASTVGPHLGLIGASGFFTFNAPLVYGSASFDALLPLTPSTLLVIGPSSNDVHQLVVEYASAVARRREVLSRDELREPILGLLARTLQRPHQ